MKRLQTIRQGFNSLAAKRGAMWLSLAGLLCLTGTVQAQGAGPLASAVGTETSQALRIVLGLTVLAILPALLTGFVVDPTGNSAGFAGPPDGQGGLEPRRSAPRCPRSVSSRGATSRRSSRQEGDREKHENA